MENELENGKLNQIEAVFTQGFEVVTRVKVRLFGYNKYQLAREFPVNLDMIPGN